MNFYVYMVLGYAILLGVNSVFKKKATANQKESVVLVLYTGLSFALSLIWVPFGVGVQARFVGVLAFKGLILAVSWFFVFRILKSADVSIVSLSVALSSVISLFAGVFLFGEGLACSQIVGTVIVVCGIVAINIVSYKERKKIEISHIIVLILSAVFNAFSSIIDKYTASGTEFYQVQFWFLLFLFVFSLLFFIVDCLKSKEILIHKEDLKNYWVYLLALTLFIGDCLLFLSYRMPNASLVSITIISKFKTVVGVIIGAIVFKESNILLKIIISIIVVAGILLVSLG